MWERSDSVWINICVFGLIYKTISQPWISCLVLHRINLIMGSRLPLLSSAAQHTKIYKHMPIRTTSQPERSLLGVWWDGLALFPADKSPSMCFANFSAVVQHAKHFQASILWGIVNNLSPLPQHCWKWSFSSTSICSQHRAVVVKSELSAETRLPPFCYVLAMFISCGSIFVQTSLFWTYHLRWWTHSAAADMSLWSLEKVFCLA